MFMFAFVALNYVFKASGQGKQGMRKEVVCEIIFVNYFLWSGFEESKESLAVQEITDKMTNFNIETDTDVNINTDTGTHSLPVLLSHLFVSLLQQKIYKNC